MTATDDMPWVEKHPFISFPTEPSRDLIRPMWALLGECSSKIEHVSGTPLDQPTAARLLSVFVAKGVHATTAIEGNTLSEEQVLKRVDQQELNLPPSQQYLQQEIDNLLAACNSIPTKIVEGRQQFRLVPDDLREFNRTILGGLDLPDGVVPGEYRQYVVVVGDYRAPDAMHVNEMVSRMCRWLNEGQFAAEFGPKFVSPILRAIMAHLYIAWIHPFGDGNGRTARVVELDILLRAGVPLVCAHLLSDHYNRTRTNYYRALSAARQHPHHFVEYAILGLRDALVAQISMIRNLQVQTMWTNYVHSIFHTVDDHSGQARRRREVALCLAKQEKPVLAEQITQLSPKLAVMYSQRTARTLQRDLVALRRHNLVVHAPDGIRANLELVHAFRPFAGKGAKPE